MPLLNSDSAILLTDDPAIREMLTSIFSRHGISTEQSGDLGDPEALRSRMSADGSTSHLHKALLGHLKEKGLPAVIAMDLRLKSGPAQSTDKDSLKTVRMLIASCILFSRMEGFENFTAHILLLGRSNDPMTAEIERNPRSLLSGIKTPNESLNAYIDELRSDPKKFRSLFMIRLMRTDSEHDKNSLEADIFIRTVLARRNLTTHDKKAENRTAMDNATDVPAKILYRTDDGRIIIDGVEQVEYGGEDGEITKGMIIISGSWNHRTQRNVAEKLVKLITRGITGVKTFTTDEEIIIRADKRCTMDGSTAVSIAGMVVRELSAFNRLTILVNSRNESLLRNSQGYSLIKKHIRIMDD